MRAEKFSELIRKQPFEPLRMHMTDGRMIDITHPDQVMVLRQRIDVGIPTAPGFDILEWVEHCSLLHLVRVEPLRRAAGENAVSQAN